MQMNATCSSLVLVLAALLSGQALAEGAVGRLLTGAGALASGPVPAPFAVAQACRDDALCAARLIAQSLGPRARLERVRHPDTDSIRRVHTAPSLKGPELLCGDMLRFELVRFGRKAVSEIEQAVARANDRAGGNIRGLEIDLRRNGGGNLYRMLRVAALFLGKVPDAIRLTRAGESRSVDIAMPPRQLSFANIVLLIGPHTASSAEIFTALLRARAGARVRGERSFGKDYLLRVLPVNQDWQLLVPAETVSVPGASLSGGITPDMTGQKKQRSRDCHRVGLNHPEFTRD